MYLGQNHNPQKNARLLSQLAYQKINIKEAVEETNAIFHRVRDTAPLPILKPSFIKRIFFNAAQTDCATYVDEEGRAYPAWKALLDEEYNHLLKRVRRIVNVKDYGAKGDGRTDDTEAFRKAIGKGRVRVHIPAGVFVTKGLRLPSWTYLEGEGKGTTIIKLHHAAPRGTRLITNANYRRGNRNIYVQGMTLDWNVERLSYEQKTSTGGNHSSCLTFANVTFGWVKDVTAVNPGLHCFDISSPAYSYEGDGTRAWGGSKYVWLDNLNGFGFGDDGVTTHHSENILISNCHMCDPSGRAHQKGFSNSNGIEIDDGSRNVWLVNNSTARCFGGVEIKAHHNSSAASNVQIIGHLSVNDNRSYNFRHIGHHTSTDTESKTAYNIRATNLVSVAPVYTNLYTGSNPRSMVISAYKNVVINHFTIIGDPGYDYKGNPILAIQYRARNIVLRNIDMHSFKTSGTDIQIFGGKQRADCIELENVSIRDSAPQAIHVGAGIQQITIHRVHAKNKNGTYGLKAVNALPCVSEFHATGYEVPILIDENK